MDSKVKQRIRTHALDNALKFDGKASMGAVIGKVLSEFPELKKDMASLRKDIQSIVVDINSKDIDEQKQLLKDLAPEKLVRKKKEKRGMPKLPHAEKGKVVTRIPPEPSKYNHIGHALSFLLNYIYARRYQGSCVLRFEDTNPSASRQEYVDAMEEDVLEYLDIRPNSKIFVSDDMEKFYDACETLISKGHAYVCSCDRESMQKARNEGTGCDHRDQSEDRSMDLWKEMLQKKHKEGSMVVRLKGDMESKNHAMRDPVIMRISYDTHYRRKDKYCVWPLYDLENALEDAWCNVTHILRSNEFGTMRIELQEHIKKLLDLPLPVVVQYGRFNITGAISKGREIREQIEKGEMSGWDDPRLVTLRALKRRGIVRETYYELAEQVGLSPSPTNIDFDTLATINRKILDRKANRYFFVQDPVRIRVDGAPDIEAELDLHPEAGKGGRKFHTGDTFYIAQADESQMTDGLVRLMDLLNFRKKGSGFCFVSEDVKDYKKEGGRIIHWLPADADLIRTEILMPDNTKVKGLAEAGISRLEEGAIIQFERFGFCRLEKQGDPAVFVFGHK